MKALCLVFIIFSQAQAQMVEIHTPNFTQKSKKKVPGEKATSSCDEKVDQKEASSEVCSVADLVQPKKKSPKKPLDMAKDKLKTKTKTQ